MSIHVQTGGQLDVVLECDEHGKEKIVGLQPWGKEFIPLHEPVGLLEVLQKLLIREPASFVQKLFKESK